jgi:hypothetical protein
MKVKLKNLLQADSAITNLTQQDALPAKYQWRISSLIEVISDYQKVHQKTMKKYSTINEKGEEIVESLKIIELTKELEALQEEEKEIDFEPIDINDLLLEKNEKGEPVIKMTAQDYINFKPFYMGTPNF